MHDSIHLYMRNPGMMEKQFFENSWCQFEHDPRLGDWVNAVLPLARQCRHDPQHEKWLRCGGTWFAGVNVLPNQADGSAVDSLDLQGDVIEFIHQVLKPGEFDWDQAQISICYPGYPQAMQSESVKSFRYRQNFDAAHVDGFLPEGPDRRRHLREYHGFILGIPLSQYDAYASPLVVWQGSHELVRQALITKFENIETENWGEQDITDCYHAVRREIFELCPRVTIAARPGEAYLVHRLALHGIAPWAEGAQADADGRMICYFRPEVASAKEWLFNP